MLNWVLIVCVWLCATTVCNARVVSSDGADADVGFPDVELPDVDRTNTRIPLYIPGKCPQNQLLFPGNQKTDWICDCGFGMVYYHENRGCFPVYRQGPCSANQYLVLRPGEFNPVCVKNPCQKDGFVEYKGVCYELNKAGGPCPPIETMAGIFGINSITLQPECIKGTDRFSALNTNIACPPGSIRDQQQRCAIVA